MIYLGRILPISAISAASRTNAANPDFDQFINDLAEDIVRRSPALATSSQYFSRVEQGALDRSMTASDLWGPLSPVRRVQRLESTRQRLEQFRRIQPSELSPRQRITRGTLEWKLQDVARTTEFADQSCIFDQIFGQQIGGVNLLTVTHPIHHASDIENDLARLLRVGPVIDEGIAGANARAAAGVVPPKFSLQSTIAQLDRFLADPPAKNIFVTSLSQRTALLTSLPPDTRTTAIASAEKITGDQVIPAFRRGRALLAGQMATAMDVALCEATAWHRRLSSCARQLYNNFTDRGGSPCYRTPRGRSHRSADGSTSPGRRFLRRLGERALSKIQRDSHPSL